MTRTESQEETFTKLWAEHAKAFQRWQWFPGSNYAVRHLESTQRKLNAYAQKYGPFQCTLESGHIFTYSGAAS